jgi:hypothetical protein
VRFPRGEAVDGLRPPHCVEVAENAGVKMPIVVVELPAEMVGPNVGGGPNVAWSKANVVAV